MLYNCITTYKILIVVLSESTKYYNIHLPASAMVTHPDTSVRANGSICEHVWMYCKSLHIKVRNQPILDAYR